MEEMPLPQQVGWYLKRLRHTLPFPCTPEDCYFGLLPEAIRQWHENGWFEREDGPSPGKAGNLLLSMVVSTSSILHVSVDYVEDYLEAQRGNRGYEHVFWFALPLTDIPLPHNSMQTPFFLPFEHPYQTVITDWVRTAYSIENEIQRSLELVRAYSKRMHTYTDVHRTWPELLSFVRFKNTQRHATPSNITDKGLDKTLTPAVKDGLITQLAKASMLEDPSGPLRAWVKFYTPEIQL